MIYRYPTLNKHSTISALLMNLAKKGIPSLTLTTKEKVTATLMANTSYEQYRVLTIQLNQQIQQWKVTRQSLALAALRHRLNLTFCDKQF